MLRQAAQLLEELACCDPKKIKTSHVFRAGEVVSALSWWRTQLENMDDTWAPPEIEGQDRIPIPMVMLAAEWMESLALDASGASRIFTCGRAAGALRIRAGACGQAADATGSSTDVEDRPGSGSSSPPKAGEE